MLIDHLDQLRQCANVADDMFTKSDLNALFAEKNRNNEIKKQQNRKEIEKC